MLHIQNRQLFQHEVIVLLLQAVALANLFLDKKIILIRDALRLGHEVVNLEMKKPCLPDDMQKLKLSNFFKESILNIVKALVQHPMCPNLRRPASPWTGGPIAFTQ